MKNRKVVSILPPEAKSVGAILPFELYRDLSTYNVEFDTSSTVNLVD